MKIKTNGERSECVEKSVANGMPEAYAVGKAWFYREEYDITPDVLIPRPDTERAVEKLCALLPRGGHFADLCSGSGCIGISCLCERGDAKCDAFDICPAAVGLALHNAEKNGVADRYSCAVSDVFSLDDAGWDIIVSNPPYIPSTVIPTLDESVRLYEPLIALDGGEDGLDFYRAMLDAFCPRECFIFEIGYDEGEAICALALERGMTCEISKDYGGNDRVAVIRRKI